jgi:hypothetical protein
VFLNLAGRRFDDEFLGDEITVHAAIHEPEATVMLVYDEAIRRERAVPPPGSPAMRDRLRNIQSAGGQILEAQSLQGLVEQMTSAWSLHPRALQTLQRYNEVCLGADPAILDAPKSGGLHALETAPFYGIRLLVGMTFPYGGIAIDPSAAVLDSGQQPIRGLFAAGADAGGIYTLGYCGGLCLGLAFGLKAGRAAASIAAKRK